MEFRTFQKQWGAEFISDDVVRFRVWAEGQKKLTLRLANADVPMTTTVGAGSVQTYPASHTGQNISLSCRTG